MLITDKDIQTVRNYYPRTATIILTFECNAMCAECCFECGPNNPFSLKEEDVLSLIDRISEISDVKFLIWTGGEAFLKYRSLLEGIKYANEKYDIRSRVVTNGFWATSKTQAKKKLAALVDAGLSELNLSTGDNHQEYIPVERVVTAAISAVELGIPGLITVERTKESEFELEHIYELPIYQEFEKSKYFKSGLFKAFSSIWVSFHEDNKYEYVSQNINSPEIANGCDNIFSSIVVDPKNKMLSCCGITVEYIDELQLDFINSDNNSIIEVYDSQKNDFMKQWLFVDGPVRILNKVMDWNREIKPPKFHHFCQTCAYVFNNEKVKSTILEHYSEIIEDVQYRFIEKIKLKNMLQERYS